MSGARATTRWAALPPVADWAAPEVFFDDHASAQEIDRGLRELAAARATLEEVIGACAYAIRRSGMHLRLGFSTFRHYVEERLRLFLEPWKHVLMRPSSRSERIRDRDLGWCQVPGCSHRAAHSHHVLYRSRGGGDDPENQVALCAFHHLRCVHGGYLTVFGRAPDGLTWLLNGAPWTGRGAEAPADVSSPRGRAVPSPRGSRGVPTST